MRFGRIVSKIYENYANVNTLSSISSRLLLIYYALSLHRVYLSELVIYQEGKVFKSDICRGPEYLEGCDYCSNYLTRFCSQSGVEFKD